MEFFRFFIGLKLLLVAGVLSAAQFTLLENDSTSEGLILQDALPVNYDMFSASNGVSGQEPWVTDGSPSGTRMLLDINPGASGSFPRGFYSNGELWYFFAMDNADGMDLWKSDGTASGTVKVSDVNVEQVVLRIIPYLDGLFFITGDGNWKFTPWFSDTTSSGTNSLIVPEGFSVNSGFVPLGDKILIAGNLQNDLEPWIIDNSSKEVKLLKDIKPGIESSLDRIDPVQIDDLLLFFADDGVHGSELWKTDGTTTGTEMVKDLIPGPAGISGWAMERISTDTVYFCQSSLWKSDGTSTGTLKLGDVVALPSEMPYQTFTSLNNIQIFAGETTASGTEIWKTDGTPMGTVMLKDIKPGWNSSNPQFFVRLNDLVYFVASDFSNGNEIWQTDGTEEGTTITYNISVGPENSDPANLTVLNDELVFSARDYYHGLQVWSYRPADHSLRIISDLTPTGFYKLSNFSAKNGSLILSGNAFSFGNSLWAYNPLLSSIISWMTYQ